MLWNLGRRIVLFDEDILDEVMGIIEVILVGVIFWQERSVDFSSKVVKNKE